MVLAWKNAQRFEASTFLLMASVWAPLPSVSDSARNSAITAISSAIFLFSPEACSACSACSMLSCALMISSRVERMIRQSVKIMRRLILPRLTEQHRLRKRHANVTAVCRAASGPISGAGMRGAVDFQQPLAVDAGVNLRGRERSVAEQLLDRAQVAASAQKGGREGMPQRMRRRAGRQAERATQPCH